MTMTWDGREDEPTNNRFALPDSANDNKLQPTNVPVAVVERDLSHVAPMKEAAQREALGQGVPFEFDGKMYLLDRPEDWDIEILELFSANDLLGAVKLLLGDNQYAEFKTDIDGNKTKRTMKDLGKILEVAMGAQGIDTGE